MTFEAKTMDVKICPQERFRGQGRPQGLHFWLLSHFDSALVPPILFVTTLSRKAFLTDSVSYLALAKLNHPS